jgi:type II secretory pathway component PulM
MKLPFAANLANFSLDSLSERDRRMLLIGTAIIAVLLVYVVIQLDTSVSSAHKRINKKVEDLAWIQTSSPELMAATPATAGPGGQSLLVIIDSSAREFGLGSALAGSDPSGPNALSVRFQKASFDSLLTWLGRLAQQYGIRVDSASIDTAGTPGLVNAAIVLHKG